MTVWKFQRSGPNTLYARLTAGEEAVVAEGLSRGWGIGAPIVQRCELLFLRVEVPPVEAAQAPLSSYPAS